MLAHWFYGSFIAYRVPVCHEFGALACQLGTVWHTRENHAKLQIAVAQGFVHGKVIAYKTWHAPSYSHVCGPVRNQRRQRPVLVVVAHFVRLLLAAHAIWAGYATGPNDRRKRPVIRGVETRKH